MSIFSLDPQERRRALDELNAEIGRSLRYYFGPTPIPQLLGFAAEMTPSGTVERASEAAVRMAAPDMTPLQRVGAGAEMLGETAGVVAPLAVGARGAMPMAEAVQEAFMGVSVPARAIGEAVAARATQPGPMPRTLYSNPLGRAPVTFDDAARAMDEGGITAYHGSPHIFKAERLVRMPDGSTQYLVGDVNRLPDVPAGAQVIEDFPMGRFRMSQMGTGEGAQAYGPGLYVAESRDVGEGYRNALRFPRMAKTSDTAAFDDGLSLRDQVIDDLNYYNGNVDPVRLSYESMMLSDFPEVKDFAAQKLAMLDEINKEFSGRLYEVNIAARPEEFIDYDLPLSAQPPNVQRQFGYVPRPTPEEETAAFELAKRESPNNIGDHPAIQELYRREAGANAAERNFQRQVTGGGMDEASRIFLSEAGIPGVRYLDAGSRNPQPNWRILTPEESTSGKWVVGTAPNGPNRYFDNADEARAFFEANKPPEPTRNYVVFDDNLLRIVRVYGIGGAAAILGVSAADVEAALAENLPPSEWESLVVGPQ